MKYITESEIPSSCQMYVRFDLSNIIAQTEKAILAKVIISKHLGEKEIWMPKSQMLVHKIKENNNCIYFMPTFLLLRKI